MVQRSPYFDSRDVGLALHLRIDCANSGRNLAISMIFWLIFWLYTVNEFFNKIAGNMGLFKVPLSSAMIGRT